MRIGEIATESNVPREVVDITEKNEKRKLEMAEELQKVQELH